MVLKNPGRRFVVGGAAGGLAAVAGLGAGPAFAKEVAVNPVSLGAIVTDKDRTLSITAEGVRRRGGPEPVTTNDLWHIGSNTKAMTAALYGRLVDRALASWDTPLAQLFPSITVHPGWQGATARQLLSQTAGLSDRGLLGPLALIRSELDARPLSEQRLAFAARGLGSAPAGKPGRFEYANANYVLIGAAIEHLTGTSWEEALTAELFRPLGMNSAGFGAPTGNQPWGHAKALLPGRAPHPVPPGPAADNPPFMRPAGGVHLGLEDYARFLRLFLRGQTPFLTAPAMAALVRPVGPPPAYALGWLIEDHEWAGGTTLAHEGSNTMWHIAAVIAPRLGLAAAAVSNEARETAADATRRRARSLIEQYAAKDLGGPSAG